MNQNIEWQISNLELSEKLEKLGVKQESLFWWIRMSNKRLKKRWYCTSYSDGKTPMNDLEIDRFYSAFTVAELGKELKKYTFSLPIFNILNKRDIWFTPIIGFPRMENENEANARAMLLIYIKENKLKRI